MTNIAVIISQVGKIVAIVHNAEVIPSGTVEYAYDSTTDALSGKKILVNPRLGKLSKTKKYIESREARECLASAKCISTETYHPRFIVTEN